jgi:hypothetical protein
MRLVSSVELMAVRERVHNNLSPLDRPIDDVTFTVLRNADAEFQTWYANWDQAFSQKYEDAGTILYISFSCLFELKKCPSFLSSEFDQSTYACGAVPQWQCSTQYQRS